MGEDLTAKATLVIAVLTLGLIIATVIVPFAFNWYVSLPAEIRIQQPTAYSIIRNYNDWNTDILILTVVFENNGGTPKTIRNINLLLTPVQFSNKKDEYNFDFFGYFDKISHESLSNGHTSDFSVTIPPHDSIKLNLAFRPKFFWDQDIPTHHDFNFMGEEVYSVKIEYEEDINGSRKYVKFDDFTIIPLVDSLTPYRYNKNFWESVKYS